MRSFCMEPEFPSAQLYLNSLVLEEQQYINEGCWLIPGGGGLHWSEPGWPFRSPLDTKASPKGGWNGGRWKEVVVVRSLVFRKPWISCPGSWKNTMGGMRTLLLCKEWDRGQGYYGHGVGPVMRTKLYFKDKEMSFSLEGNCSAVMWEVENY